MSKVRTLTQLCNLLDADMAWRIKELSDLKTSIRKVNNIHQDTLLRAGLALMYAHWEGFVKNSAMCYLEFVSSQGKNYEDLKPCFVAIGFKGEIESLKGSKKYHINGALIDMIKSNMNKRARINTDGVINTMSNLNSEVLEIILGSIGIDYLPYSTRANFIDVSLLKNRNSIAHGDYSSVTAAGYEVMHDEVVVLLRSVKNDILNAAISKAYLSSP